MKTKREKLLFGLCIVLLCIVLTVMSISVALILVFANSNKIVPNKDKFTVREHHDWLALTAVGNGLFSIDNFRYYPALEITYDPADRTTSERIIDYIINYKFENANLYCYAEDGYAVVYAESNLCKVFITPPTDLTLDGLTTGGRLSSDDYRISELPRDEHPENKFIIYLDSFDEFSEYEQKILKSLK